MNAPTKSETAQLARLSRIEGQLRGVQKMIANGRYCLEITTQIEAAIGALQNMQWDLVSDMVRAAALEANRQGDAAPLQDCISGLLHASEASSPARRSRVSAVRRAK